MSEPRKWVQTPLAAAILAVSPRTLKRWCDTGLLSEGKHWRRGPFPNSPKRWDLAAVEAALIRHSYQPPRVQEEAAHG